MVVVVVAAPVGDDGLGFEEAGESSTERYSTRSRALNDSIHAFCQCDPGSM